jgi:hypothetical protein
MWDYLKFWMAKELVPFIILAAIFAIFFFLYGFALIADAVNRWRRRRIPRLVSISGLRFTPASVAETGTRLLIENTSGGDTQIDGFGSIGPGELRVLKSVRGRWKRARVRELVERWRRRDKGTPSGTP